MKILLRNHNGEQYVWKTAKYEGNYFRVDGANISPTNIVSVINDNRKNYIKCSSCGKVFRKGDPKFDKHKRESATPAACLGCMYLDLSRLK